MHIGFHIGFKFYLYMKRRTQLLFLYANYSMPMTRHHGRVAGAVFFCIRNLNKIRAVIDHITEVPEINSVGLCQYLFRN